MRRWMLAVTVVAALAGTAFPKIRMPEAAPVTRLLANLDAALKAKPDDPHLLYLLGRMHAVAYAQGDGARAVIAHRADPKEPETPEISRLHGRLKFLGTIDVSRSAHLRAGIVALRRAAALLAASDDTMSKRDEDEAAFLELGLAWLLDDGSRFAPTLGHPESESATLELTRTEQSQFTLAIEALGAPDEADRRKAFDTLRGSLDRAWQRLVALRNASDETIRAAVGRLLTAWWQDQALHAYRKAYAMTKAAETADVGFSGALDISGEAGTAILRLLEGRPLTAAIVKERADIEKTLKALKARSMAISPVIFPVRGEVSLAELLPPGRTSRFDVAGDGVVRTWPWPSADAAFLVWSPETETPIVSGRQLFGARTWWILWRDGYEPLAMLDDDANGRLAGAELDGIGVWRDADGDGVSDPGEVVAAAAYGVEWIAVAATRREDGVPANDRGLGLRDGSTRPTYDWTPASLPEPAPPPARP